MLQPLPTADYDVSQSKFMRVAFWTALESNDPRNKAGACIVNGEGQIVGIGYNRLPKNMQASESWEMSKNIVNHEKDSEDIVRLSKWLHTKYPYIVYADMDAILKKTCSSLEGCTLYTLLYPWHESAKLIVETGIKKVIVFSDKYDGKAYTLAAERILKAGNVKVFRFDKDKDGDEQELTNLAAKTINIPKSF